MKATIFLYVAIRNRGFLTGVFMNPDLSAAQQAQGVLAEPKVSVLIRELDQNNVCLQIRFWTDSRRADFLETASAVQTAVVDALNTAGVALPDPAQRSIRLLNDRQHDAGQSDASE